ncbi:YciI family protein [Cellulomonas wangsupingiae]|uniref:YciI family protein n=1 Tax=Cellulomonas wangsupingiae TaxID=2968085 RepID=A0ABY5K6G8_9CELL|nr:YciI family protein [Cellulomonas wangsupingiae]MCC2334268.1 YciI family protein [Cellulomonas wangsupingiae]MCM0641268.1 YciI family protein [Cellulomonas wangsupingiae]UUI65945.1 YciI family protein [Cellulomonas wangsupingiae]
MRYSILLHYPQTTPEQLGEEAWAAGEREFTAYAATLQAAGVLVGAEVLQPSTSTTTLRTVDGVLQVQDGPFADTKEQLGGTFVVDVPDLDAAIDLARRAPSIGWGPVEVRPGATYTVDGVWTPNA